MSRKEEKRRKAFEKASLTAAEKFEDKSKCCFHPEVLEEEKFRERLHGLVVPGLDPSLERTISVEYHDLINRDKDAKKIAQRDRRKYKKANSRSKGITFQLTSLEEKSREKLVSLMTPENMSEYCDPEYTISEIQISTLFSNFLIKGNGIDVIAALQLGIAGLEKTENIGVHSQFKKKGNDAFIQFAATVAYALHRSTEYLRAQQTDQFFKLKQRKELSYGEKYAKEFKPTKEDEKNWRAQRKTFREFVLKHSLQLLQQHDPSLFQYFIALHSQ